MRNNSHDFVIAHVRRILGQQFGSIASSNRHEVQPWLAARLDYAPGVLDLAEEGFPLRAGQVDYVLGRNVAALTYLRRRHVISLFILPREHVPAAFSVKGQAGGQSRGLNVRHWQTGPFHYIAISDVNSADLSRFARLYQGRLREMASAAGGK